MPLIRCLFVCLLIASAARAESGKETVESAANILRTNCLACHSGALAQSNLKLDAREAALRGGKRGPALVSGDASASHLFRAVNHQAEIAMPPGAKLGEGEIATLRRWIDEGAAWPEAKEAEAKPTWWSFVTPKRPAVPDLNNSWVRSPVDAFILAKLRQENLTPAPEAEKLALLRRAHYDLTGLPPTPEQIEKFLQDSSPDAWGKVVDELLASPRYGERWGRHWLDVVRYGDTAGFEQDPHLLYAWRYRDYVIDSFNKDKPYDVFVKEQIAGDEIYPDDPPAMSGTGYYTVGPNRDMLYKVEDVNRIETLTDYVDTTSSVFLGLTVGCARCHDHKFDPISQRDYHRMQAIFVALEKTQVFLQYDPSRSYNLAAVSRHARLREVSDQIDAILGPHKKRISDGKLAVLDPEVQAAFAAEAPKRTPRQRELVEQNGSRIGAPDTEVRAALSTEEKEGLHEIEVLLVSMFSNYKDGPFSPGVRDISRESPKVLVPVRGKPGPGEDVGVGFPEVFGPPPIPEPPLDASTTYRRKALAEWVASPDHPLTARVMVNRVWQYHFGEGLVSTPSDFGRRGAPPSHPELLDWLATEFVANGWSMKKLHRLIMTSSVYRLSAAPPADSLRRDPNNQFLSHFSMRRLSPEEIRDSMLLASGSLNLEMGGRPVVPPIDKEELQGLSQGANSAWPVTADTEEHRRRSVYMFSRRTFRPSMFETFDAPDGIRSCPRRDASTTAPQSLTLLNGGWTLEQARSLAARVSKDAGSESDRIKLVWRHAYGRNPDAGELDQAMTFLATQQKALGSLDAALTEMARGIFNTNEFLYVE